MRWIRKAIWGAIGSFAYRKGKEWWRDRQQSEARARAATSRPDR